MIDHDRLFKELLTTFFAEFVELFLPELSRYLDRDRLEFLDKEVFTDITAGEKHEADLVVKAAFRSPEGPSEAFFLVHIENQAKREPAFGKRMFRYFARLHEKHDLPVYPVALLSYDAPTNPEPDEYAVRFPDRTVLEFRYRVIQLNRLNWRDFVRQPNPVASALMAKMRIAREDRPKAKLECLRLLATLKLNPAQMRLISGFVDSYLRLNRREMEVFEGEIEEVEGTEKERVMEIVTSWMEEGIHKGIRQGIPQGIHQGQEALVLRLLKRRIGAVPPKLRSRIHALAAPQLEDLGEALLDFQSPSELERWLEQTVPA